MKSIKTLQGACIPESQMNLVFESRLIWRDLATWIEVYLISVFAGFGNYDSVEEKLRTVIIKFSNILSTVFGGEVADQFVTLISNYISTFKSLVASQVNGDTEDIKKYTDQLSVDTGQIAAFLSGINPFWTERDWNALFDKFNQMIIDESLAFLDKEYTENIESFDRILNLTSVMGNYYSKGLLNYLTYAS
ncbi:hypothetical protein [Aminipila terrae]|uniref:Uncharacterized protein n=1 Tax=Aminipila terrae TaxID=2697030 RepID=A0A6P1MEZ2_9FIRM|nr:hypothetical protein [Aminipila terrae]QHI73279.1 hypothetical protein Ami3637_13630 [Aminipila terrae]